MVNQTQPSLSPPRERITNAFEGFSAGVTPMWGSTPFNNYLFVFKRE